MTLRPRLISLISLSILALASLTTYAQRAAPGGQYPASLLAGLQWRDVGPML